MFNFLKKYFLFIFIIIFVIIFSNYYWNEYLKYYNNSNSKIVSEKETIKNIKNFSLDKIRKLDNSEIFYTPYLWLLDKIVWKIKNANNRVYLESYMLTETRIKEALVKAKKKWVDVKVILEKNPYKAIWINNKHFKFLKKSWINIVWSNPENFSLNHSKFIIIDNEVIISTWNFTYSSFAFNRDFLVFLTDKKILEKMLEIFSNDFLWINKSIYDDNLVLSPSYSRVKFEKLFLWANKKIDLYFQYFSDEELEKLLIKKAKEWVIINAIVSKTFYEEKKDKINYLKKNNIKIKYLEKQKMHSKAILIDNKYLFLWSVNFSKYSLDFNREVWILLKSKKNIEKFIIIFDKDFN